MVLNSAMTADGKIATVGGYSDISCDRDLDRVHELRCEVDAIMVGKGTVKVDNPKLTVRRCEGKDPLRVVVADDLEISPDSNVFDGSSRTILAVPKSVDGDRLEEFKSKNVDVFISEGDEVNLEDFLDHLKDSGIDKVLLEGGACLNWKMFNLDLVDEVRIFIKPTIVGGKSAKSLVDGEGFEKVKDGISMELNEVKEMCHGILINYRVVRDD